MDSLQQEQQKKFEHQVVQEDVITASESRAPSIGSPVGSNTGSTGPVTPSESIEGEQLGPGSAKPAYHSSFTPGRTNKTPEELAKQQEIDSRSVYVGNVDYKTTPDELESFFHACGAINRVTILFDRFTGFPKGYAYVEFENKDSVTKAVKDLNGLDFKGRTISVVEKRTNLPGFRRARGRGGFNEGVARGFSGQRGRGLLGRGGNRGRGGRPRLGGVNIHPEAALQEIQSNMANASSIETPKADER